MSRILQWLLFRRVRVPSGSACVARTISSASTQKSTMGTPPKSSVRRVHRLRCQQIPIRQPCVEKQISGVCIHFGWGASRSNSAALRRKEISGVCIHCGCISIDSAIHNANFQPTISNLRDETRSFPAIQYAQCML